MNKEIRVSIAGANDLKIFELVDSFHDNIFFDLFGVGKPEYHFWSNVLYTEVDSDEEAVRLAVQDVLNGADVIFKGLVQTHIILKEVLKKEYDLVQKKLLSHIAIIEIPSLKRPVLLTDAAMNIDPDIDQERLIIENAIDIAHSIGIKSPKVSLLSSAENFNPKMPSSVKAKDLTEFYQDKKIDATVYGPLSLDISLSKEIAEEKRFTGPIQGDTDVLVVPNIDVGNVLYKSLTMFTNAKVGGMIVGTKVPIVLTSRGDSLENKILSLKFALKTI
ncbi:phosphate acyltransferase [Companilactobacillus jidongensis]|uniref:phosphate acyltransferase n=1 Tax=Companilactobacillus jidongensis TaxID=2486006 RepID=UPI001CDBDC51|nr:phosphate acyltransferase [Companilactobacillus jidongensis]